MLSLLNTKSIQNIFSYENIFFLAIAPNWLSGKYIHSQVRRISIFWRIEFMCLIFDFINLDNSCHTYDLRRMVSGQLMDPSSRCLQTSASAVQCRPCAVCQCPLPGSNCHQPAAANSKHSTFQNTAPAWTRTSSTSSPESSASFRRRSWSRRCSKQEKK